MEKVVFGQAEICSLCAGACCKKIPGIYHPDDFKGRLNSKTLSELIDRREVAVDVWDIDDETTKEIYYLRPPTVNHSGYDYIDRSWGGKCVHLTATGCKLPDKDKPLQCRSLEPHVVEGEVLCVQHISKKDMVDSWVKYQGNIKNAIRILWRRDDEEEA